MPADATIVALRKDVAKALREKAWSQEFEPVESYTARIQLEEVEQLKVTVMKAEWGIDTDNRTEWENDYAIDIGIQYRAKAALGVEAIEKFDALMLLEQEFVEYFQENRAGTADAPLMSVAVGPGGNGQPYIPDFIETLNQFTAVVRLTFRKWR